MSVLWRRGSATVADVRDALAGDLAYTSVPSALQTLEDKGYVRLEPEGRAYRYFPTVAAEQAGTSALARIRDAASSGSRPGQARARARRPAPDRRVQAQSARR